MASLELVVAIGLAVLVVTAAARRVHVPPPALLLVAGILLGLVPALRETHLSTVLVVLAAALVACATHALGMMWGPAWVLGAALAPTDATAVSVLGRVLPRRLAETLRAENLVNDGTGLVVYGLAIAVTAEGEELTAGRLGLMVLI